MTFFPIILIEKTDIPWLKVRCGSSWYIYNFVGEQKRTESVIPGTPGFLLSNHCNSNSANNLCKILKSDIFSFDQSGIIGSLGCTIRHVLRCAATNTLPVKFKREFELDL
jgi:hypothetical protein